MRQSCDEQDDPVSCVKACEAKINMEFVNGFMTVAATYPEINEAARKFIGTLMQELAATVATVKAFCYFVSVALCYARPKYSFICPATIFISRCLASTAAHATWGVMSSRFLLRT